MERLMKQICLGIIYGLVIAIAIILTISWYQSQRKEVSMASAVVATSTEPSQMSEEDQQYAKINPNCALYYENLGVGTDSFSVELSDFTNLHPLADFLCGKYSDVMKMTLSDGKTLYFIAPISSLGCGSGGCTYYPMLEVRPGVVRHLRGFDAYSDAGSTTTATVQKDTDGSVFGFLSFGSQRHSVDVYWHESAQCGTTNTYAFNSKDEPVLISASDSCLPGKGILYPTK